MSPEAVVKLELPEITPTAKTPDADVAWRTRDLNCQHGGFIIHEGYVYGNHGGGWSCLDLKTGEVLWKERAVGKGSLCFADGMLYLFAETKGQAA